MDVIVTLGIGLDHYTVQDAHGVSMGGDCGIQLIVHLSSFLINVTDQYFLFRSSNTTK